MFTSEQEAFLKAFADKKMIEEKEIVKRNEDNQTAYEALLARNDFESEIRSQKEAEIEVALAAFDAENRNK